MLGDVQHTLETRMAGLDPGRAGGGGGGGQCSPTGKIYSKTELNSSKTKKDLFLHQKCLNANSSGHKEP